MTDRYHRQKLLEGFGERGQERLASAHALVVGCGALGCASADLLARAGVGRLTLVDRDLVDLTNLQRQVLFDEADAEDATPKAIAAARRLARVNSGVRTNPVVADFSSVNAESIALRGPHGTPDVILDGTDNFETRFLLNDLAVKHRIPFIYGGAVATTGMTLTFLPGTTRCLRCHFQGPPPPGSQPTCDTAGVLGPLVALVAAEQAVEAFKVLLGRADLVRRAVHEFDPWRNRRREIDAEGRPDPSCPCCVAGRFEFLDAPPPATASLCGHEAVQVTPERPGAIDLAALAQRLAGHGPFEATRFMVRGSFTAERTDTGRPVALTVFADGRTIVHGVTDPVRARSLYAKYIGA